MTGEELSDLLDATWPPAAYHDVPGVRVREGQGGGQRVSAATLTAPLPKADIAAAEARMIALRQRPLFMVRAGEDALDAALAERGYGVVDPVVVLAGPVEALTATPPTRLAAFDLWPPLAIMEEIWAEGGIGPERRAIMDRAPGPKTAILGRVRDRAAGAGFVSLAGDTAMVHSLEVTKPQRRHGAAHQMMRCAGRWAQDQGARTLAVAVTCSNQAARALYSSLGLVPVGEYHYRARPEPPEPTEQ